MAEESAREDGTRGHGNEGDRDKSVLHSHFLPTSLFWVKKCSGSACQPLLVIVILPSRKDVACLSIPLSCHSIRVQQLASSDSKP